MPTAAALPAITLHELKDTTAISGVKSWSPFCVKVHLALNALGLPYARAFGPFPSTWKRLNVTGQVPVVRIGVEVIADSTSIVRRLCALGTGGLNDGFTPRQNAEALLLEEFADSDLNGFLVASRWLDDDNWPRTRAALFAGAPAPIRAVVPVMARRSQRSRLVARDIWRRGPDACWARFATLLDALDARAPSTGSWFGEGLSTADVAIAAQLKSLQTPLTPAQAAQVHQRANLTAWVDRVFAKAASMAA